MQILHGRVDTAYRKDSLQIFITRLDKNSLIPLRPRNLHQNSRKASDDSRPAGELQSEAFDVSRFCSGRHRSCLLKARPISTFSAKCALTEPTISCNSPRA